MRFGTAAALVVLGWALILPSRVPEYGEANAASPSITIWNIYPTKEKCEADRLLYSNDPVIGARMRAGACTESVTESPTPKPK